MDKITGDLIFNAYIEAALWSTTDDTEADASLSTNYSVSDIDLDSLKQMRADCDKFVELAREPLALVPGWETSGGVGHDFWLTRNGHGAGFWDSPEAWGGQENADKLTEIAKSFGECDLYVGDDDVIYVAGAEAKTGPELGANLDAINDDALLEQLALGYHGLYEYAKFKRGAIEKRKAGNIGGAQYFEGRCDEIYKQLPAWAKTW